jgi:hypothetical protein
MSVERDVHEMLRGCGLSHIIGGVRGAPTAAERAATARRVAARKGATYEPYSPRTHITAERMEDLVSRGFRHPMVSGKMEMTKQVADLYPRLQKDPRKPPSDRSAWKP